MAGFYETIFGRDPGFKQGPSNYDPQQINLIQRLGQMGLEGLGTDKIEGAARRNYQTNTIPLLSQRFASSGGLGSSQYQNALQDSGTDLELQLAALRQGNANNLLNAGLTPYQNNYFDTGSEGLAAPLIGAAGNVAASYASGGLSSLFDLYNSYFGKSGQSNAPTSYTGVQAEATSPLRQRLASQTPQQLVGPQLQRNLGLPSGQLPPRAQAANMAQQGGQINVNRLLAQAQQAHMPRAAQGASLNAFLNRSYPGFEL